MHLPEKQIETKDHQKDQNGQEAEVEVEDLEVRVNILEDKESLMRMALIQETDRDMHLILIKILTAPSLHDLPSHKSEQNNQNQEMNQKFYRNQGLQKSQM